MVRQMRRALGQQQRRPEWTVDETDEHGRRLARPRQHGAQLGRRLADDALEQRGARVVDLALAFETTGDAPPPALTV
jgi:hypothetical protein